MSLEGKTALVTGATGFLGGALARRLAAEGAQVRAMARSPEKADYIRDVPGIEVVQGDVRQPDRMRELTRGCDYVFHVAVAVGDWDIQRAVNVEGTRHVMEAATAAQVTRVVYVSSIAAYGYTGKSVLREDDPLTPSQTDAYSATKAESEKVVQQIGTAHNLSYAIIRPGMIYGPRSSQWTELMFKVAKRRPILWVGSGRGSFFPIHVDDVVDLMVLMAVHPAAHNEIFNAVNLEPVTWREYLLHYARLAGHQSWIGIPVPLVAGLARVVAALSPAGSSAKAAPEMLNVLYEQRTIDMSKTQERLGWKPRIGLQSGIESCVPYLREKGLLS